MINACLLYVCSVCGMPTDWDESLGPQPLCVTCWDNDTTVEKSHREEKRAYYLAHREERRAYYLAHREERRAYNLAHREEKRAYKRAYYLAHREEKNA
jgi:hypothetical protein